MNGETPEEEGVCPHCGRLVPLTPKLRLIASHQTYMWHEGKPDFIPAKPGLCPGFRHSPAPPPNE